MPGGELGLQDPFRGHFCRAVHPPDLRLVNPGVVVWLQGDPSALPYAVETAKQLIGRKPMGYGFYEVRAQLPCGRGIWPAAWLLPDKGTWPDMGEIDIVEMVGWNPNVVHATLHSGAFNHAKGTQRGAQKTVPTACTAFHTYQLDWRPDAITI